MSLVRRIVGIRRLGLRAVEWLRSRAGGVLPGVLLCCALTGSALIVLSVRESTAPGGAAMSMSSGGDTVTVWGPFEYWATGEPVDEWTVHPFVQVIHGRQYFLRVLNGNSGGTARPDSGYIRLLGSGGSQTILTPSELNPSTYELTAPLPLQAFDDSLRIELSGTSSDFVSVSILAYPVFQGDSGTVWTAWGENEWVATGGTDVFVEALEIDPVPGRPYYLYLLNGNWDGSQRPDSAWVILNNDTLLTPSDFAGSSNEVFRDLELVRDDTLVAVLKGDQGDHISAWIKTVVPPGGLFTVFGPATFTKTSGTSHWDTTYTLPVDGAIPHFAVLKNGNSNGTNRVDGASLVIDGSEWIQHWQVTEATDSIKTEVLMAYDSLSVDLQGDNGAFVTVELFATDELPPVLLGLLPAEDAVVAGDTATVTGTFSDRTPTTITVDGVTASIDGDAFSADVPLTSEGANVLTITAVDGGGLETDSVRTVYRDQAAPVLTVTEPADLTVTAATSITVSGTVSDASDVSVTVNAVPFTVVAGAFSGLVSLDPGPNTITVVATDAAENSSFVIRTVTRDNDPPTLIVTAPGDGSMTAESSVTVSGVVYDLTALTLTVDGMATTVASDSTFSTSVSLDEGVNNIPIVAVDAAGNKDSVSRMVTREGMELPPDPVTVAPELSQTVATTLFEANSFLWTGEDPIQTGVDSGTIDPLRVGVYRGLVLNTMGMPLPGATVGVKDHPELGETLSRADGMFDLGVNAGGTLTLEYTRDGYLPVHRDIRTGWQEFRMVDSVVMTAKDTVLTTITFTDSVEVARGSAVTDSSGTRQPTLMFEEGTLAILQRPGFPPDTLSAVTVSATEYTVGPLGPAAMPAGLPPASAYTYALELSTEEGDSLGASQVQFTKPVALYVDDFVGLPVGAVIPYGYYDRTAGQWIPEADGVVLSILSVDSLGRAVLAADSTGTEASQALLDTLGILDAERSQLASLYSVGDTLWRIETTHFSAHDKNLATAQGALDHPPNSEPRQQKNDSNCQDRGNSTIGCERQTLGEMLPITGTPFQLAYRNDRTLGWRADNVVRFDSLLTVDTAGLTLLPRNMMPSHAREVVYRVEVAGQTFGLAVPAAPIIPPQELAWNGLDGYGRPVCGSVEAKVTIGFRYNASYGTAYRGSGGGSGGGSFGAPLRLLTLIDLAREHITVLAEYSRTMTGNCPGRVAGIGGWDIDAHHSYDPVGRMLITGMGDRRVAEPRGNVIRLVPGTQGSVVNIGGLPVYDFAHPEDVAVAPDGSVFIAYFPEGLIRRLAPNGTVLDSIAISRPQGLGLGSDGSLYVAQQQDNTVSRIDTSGTVTVVAGTGASGGAGDGGPAASAQLASPNDVAVGPDGSLYIVEGNGARVRRVAPDGIISLFAGNGGVLGPSSDFEGFAAVDVPMPNVYSVDVGPDGSVYVVSGSLVRKVAPDGRLTTVAGRLQFWVGETEATRTDIGGARHIDITDEGILYIAAQHQVWRVDPLGRISRAVGSGANPCSLGVCPPGTDFGDGGVAGQALFQFAVAVGEGPDGSLYIADNPQNNIRVVRPALPGLDANDMLVGSEDGGEAYLFDRLGRHLATLDGLSGDTLMAFGYDSAGALTSVTDAFGNTTTISRSGGNPTAITGPYGHATTLSVDGNGYLSAVADPLGQTVNVHHSSTGLLDSLRNQRGYFTRFVYDTLGRLVADSGAAGGFVALVRADVDSGFTVTKTTAMGRITTYEQLSGSGGASILRVTDPAGLTSESRELLDGSTTTVGPDGTSVSVVEGADPRFGSQAPILKSLTVVTPDSLVSTITADRSVVLVDEDDPFSVVSITDQVTANGRTATRTYVDSTRTFTDVSPEGRQLSTTVDSLGRVTEVSAPGLASIEYRYDILGRLDSIISGGRVSAFMYDSLGRLATSTDPLGRTDSLYYDEADRLERRVLPGNRQVLFSYDSVGNLISLTPPSRPAHGFSYTAVDQTATYDPPNVGLATSTTTYGYNLDRQVTSITRPDSVVVEIDYDSAGRPSQITFDRGVIGMDYDSATGQVIKLLAPSGEQLSYSYDGSLPRSVEWGGSVQGTVELEYDGDLRVVSQVVSGDTVGFEYDDDGLLTRAGALVMDRNDTTGFLTRDSLGTVVAERVFDDRGAMVEYGVRVSDSLLFERAYAYDSLSRITRVIELNQGGVDTLQYSYDGAGRLYQALLNGSVTATYAYDSAGNRLSVTRPSGTEVGTYDDQDRILTYDSREYLSDANGDLVMMVDGSDTTRYDYDAFGNLVEVILPTGDTITYAIDGESRRVAKRLNGVFVRGWLYQNSLKPVAEVDSSGTLVTRFVYRTNPLVPDYMVRSDSTYRLLSDHLGSVRLVVNAATGEILQDMEYDEYGRLLLDTNPGFQPFGFAGGLWDTHAEMVRFGARDYDPTIGRWTGKDPLGFLGGDANLYSYVAEDPVNQIDPYGLQRLDDPFNTILQALVGIGDGATFGATRWFRSTPFYGGDDFTDACNLGYRIGSAVGTISSFILIGRVVQPLLRVGTSYSQVGGFRTVAVRWGSNLHYAQQIRNPMLRKFALFLRGQRIPLQGWRFADPAHLHLFRLPVYLRWGSFGGIL